MSRDSDGGKKWTSLRLCETGRTTTPVVGGAWRRRCVRCRYLLCGGIFPGEILFPFHLSLVLWSEPTLTIQQPTQEFIATGSHHTMKKSGTNKPQSAAPTPPSPQKSMRTRLQGIARLVSRKSSDHRSPIEDVLSAEDAASEVRMFVKALQDEDLDNDKILHMINAPIEELEQQLAPDRLETALRMKRIFEKIGPELGAPGTITKVSDSTSDCVGHTLVLLLPMPMVGNNRPRSLLSQQPRLWSSRGLDSLCSVGGTARDYDSVVGFL